MKNERLAYVEDIAVLDFARECLVKGLFGAKVTYKDVLDHGVYDRNADEITLTVQSVPITIKVVR